MERLDVVLSLIEHQRQAIPHQNRRMAEGVVRHGKGCKSTLVAVEQKQKEMLPVRIELTTFSEFTGCNIAAYRMKPTRCQLRHGSYVSNTRLFRKLDLICKDLFVPLSHLCR